MKKFNLFATVVATLMVTIFSNPVMAAGGKNSVAQHDTVYIAKPCPPCPDAAVNTKSVTAPTFDANPTAQPAQPAGDASGAVASNANDSLLNALIQRVEKLENRKIPAAVNVSGLKADIETAQASADEAYSLAKNADTKAAVVQEANDSLRVNMKALTKTVNGFGKAINEAVALADGLRSRVTLTMVLLAILFVAVVLIAWFLYKVSNSVNENSYQTERLKQAFLKRNPDAQAELTDEKEETQQPIEPEQP